MFGRFDLHHVGGHFATGSAIDEGNFLCTQADQGPYTVDGGVSAADNHAFFPDGKIGNGFAGLLMGSKTGEKIDAGVAALEIFSRTFSSCSPSRRRFPGRWHRSRRLSGFRYRNVLAQFDIHFGFDARDSGYRRFPT